MNTLEEARYFARTARCLVYIVGDEAQIQRPPRGPFLTVFPDGAVESTMYQPNNVRWRTWAHNQRGKA